MTQLISVLEQKISDLISTDSLLAIKAEFEAEGTRIDELAVLSQLCCTNSIPLTLKIGGPAAQRDMYEAFQLGADTILVPMVESPFALDSCVQTFEQLSKIFSGLNVKPKLSINIETRHSLQNLDLLLRSIKEHHYPISNLVIGRTDLSNSLDIADVNSSEISDISKHILLQTSINNINVTLGGNITSKSYDFIQSVQSENLVAYESRKCTFSLNYPISRLHFAKVLRFGLEFELAWLNFKTQLYSIRSNEENLRKDIIQSRLSL